MPSPPILVVEDDPFTRIVELVLDPKASPERRAAYADFFAHDVPDFDGWCDGVRARAKNLVGAEVRLVGSPEELRDALSEADGLIVESLGVTRDDIAAAKKLKAIHKYGFVLRQID